MNRRDCSGFPSQQNSTCWGAKSLDHSHHSKGGFHMVPRPGPTRPDRCWTRSREESSEIRDPQKYTPKTNLQLVGGPGEKALWKMMEFVNWDDDIPNIYIYIYVYIYMGKYKKWQPNHHPDTPYISLRASHHPAPINPSRRRNLNPLTEAAWFHNLTK